MRRAGRSSGSTSPEPGPARRMVPLGHDLESGDAPPERRLAGTRLADQSDGVATTDGQRDTAQGIDGVALGDAKRLVHIGHRDDRVLDDDARLAPPTCCRQRLCGASAPSRDESRRFVHSGSGGPRTPASVRVVHDGKRRRPTGTGGRMGTGRRPRQVVAPFPRSIAARSGVRVPSAPTASSPSVYGWAGARCTSRALPTSSNEPA